MESIWVCYKLHVKVRNFAFLILVGLTGVAFGAWSPDLDHIFKGQAMTWGHDYRFPLIVFSIVGFVYLCRYAWSRFLIERNTGATINLARETNYSWKPCQKFLLNLAGLAEPPSHSLPGYTRRNRQDMEVILM